MRRWCAKIISLITGILLSFGATRQVFASYELFLDQLKIMNIAVDDLIVQESMSRYDLAKLLNAVECEDCIHPPQWMNQKYTIEYWKNFIDLPGKDFDEIVYANAIYQNQDYYHCVAYVGEKEYMRGYPESVSPVCAGNFCGSKHVTKAEFIQVVINLLSSYIYPGYSANWKDISDRIATLKPSTPAYNYLDNSDRQRITLELTSCPQGACKLTRASVFKTYLKYCTYNIDACKMESFGKIKQAIWPVAEFNILYNQSILSQEELLKDDIHNPAKSSVILETLYKLYQVVQCDFDNDYDCDTLNNAKDSCPNQYNPSQTDTDEDGVGDVCDDDIDNDSILNPIGILDELGRINISVATPDMDNCLQVINTDQMRTLHPFIGDACIDEQDKVAIYIAPGVVKNSAPARVNFDAMTKGALKYVERDMGDGTHLSGINISHYYSKPGQYIVSAIAHGPYNQAIAKTTLILGENTASYHGIEIESSRLGGGVGDTISFKANTQGQIDYILWDFDDGTAPVQKTPLSSTHKIFSKIGSYAVSAKAYFQNQVVGGAKVRIAIGSEIQGSSLKSAQLTVPQNSEILVQSNGFGFGLGDIDFVDWDFGDGTILHNKATQMKHTYRETGPQLISQKIGLKNGKQLLSYLTIFVYDPARISSHSLQLTPTKLRLQKREASNFTVTPIGDTLPQIQSVNYQHFPFDIKRLFSVAQWPLSTENTSYQDAGLYYPKTSVLINQCQRLDAQATVVVHGMDMCLEALLRGELGQFQCDMDGDGIPDMCDNDIDGDGVLNLIGIITHEQENCAITSENIDTNALSFHVKGVCSLDNCPFTSNGDQSDLNIDGIGDACPALGSLLADTGDGTTNGNNSTDNDADGDGIPDDRDACPMLPEDFNGINDLDGCPEIGVELSCPPYGSYPGAGGDGAGEDGISCNNNGVCESGESCDCVDCVSAPQCLLCGNGVVDPLENCSNCPQDVGVCHPSDCDDLLCPGPCNSCPCQFADYANDLAPGDKVRATLMDFGRQFVYDMSNEVLIDDYIDFAAGFE